jgi:hypothetical protein
MSTIRARPAAAAAAAARKTAISFSRPMNLAELTRDTAPVSASIPQA